MKRIVTVIIVLLLVLSAGGCSSLSAQSKTNAQFNSESKTYSFATMESYYPLGLVGEIESVATTEESVYVGGNSPERPLLLKVPYTEDKCPEFDNSVELEFPELAETTKLVAVSFSSRRGVAVFGTLAEADDSSVDARSHSGKSRLCNPYTAVVYSLKGSMETSFTIDFCEEEFPQGALALPESFCVWSTHNIAVYDYQGKAVFVLSDDAYNFCQPLFLNNRLVLPSFDTATNTLAFYRLSEDLGKVESLSFNFEIENSFSVCESLDSQTLLNDGEGIYSIDGNEVSKVLDWYEMTGNYGRKYRCICQLSSTHYLLSDQDGGKLVDMVIETTSTPKRTVQIASVGLDPHMAEFVASLVQSFNSDYQIELNDYGMDTVGQEKLAADASTGKIDLIFCNGADFSLSTRTADLYPYLDNDALLSREAFPSWLLEGLEQHDELRQIWGNYLVSTIRAAGPLSVEPHPLTLRACQDVLDRNETDSPLFDPDLTSSALLAQIAPSLLKYAYNEETNEFDMMSDYVLDILRLCGERPYEFDYSRIDPETLIYSDVMALGEFGGTFTLTDRINPWNVPFRFFDGNDGGDCFASITCAQGACYMIPAGCPDKELAWQVLRNMLLPNHQVVYWQSRMYGIPTNVDALSILLDSAVSNESAQRLQRLLNNGVFVDYKLRTLSNLFVEGMQPYFAGDKDLPETVERVQAKLNLFLSEQSE